MTKNKLTSDAYYSMIREGLNCIVEDKSVKTHEQAFQLAKNDIEKFAKENNLSFASIPDIISLGGDSLPTPNVINISTYLKNFLVALPPDDISHDGFLLHLRFQIQRGSLCRDLVDKRADQRQSCVVVGGCKQTQAQLYCLRME